jgi:hypothetical protein
VFLKAVESLTILFTELLDTPNLSIDSLNVFKALLEKPGKAIDLPFTTSSVDLNINSDISFDMASGSFNACAAPLVSFDIALIVSSKSKAASFANTFIADFLPSNFCIPSNNS